MTPGLRAANQTGKKMKQTLLRKKKNLQGSLKTVKENNIVKSNEVFKVALFCSRHCLKLTAT